MIKNTIVASVTLILLVLSVFLLQKSIGCGNWTNLVKNLASYAYASPYANTAAGSCQVSYETYQLAGSYVQVPTRGGKEQSQRFPGYEVYEYLYPANPDKNDEKRKKLYSFNPNGSIEVGGNLTVNGSRTSFYNEYGSGSMGISSYDGSRGSQDNVKEVVSFTPRSADVVINGGASLNYAWDPNETEGLGPSVFLGTKGAEYLMGDGFGVSGTRKDTLIETSLIPTKDQYIWEEYFNYSSLYELSAPTAFFYKDPYFYVADNGNHRIIRYSTSGRLLERVEGGYQVYKDEEKENPERYAILGAKDWDWYVNGITVDDNGLMYVSDSANNTVIKTNISGTVWESAYHSIDRFQSRLFLDGSEDIRPINVIDLRDIAEPESYPVNEYLLAEGLEIADCGYNNQKVIGKARFPHWEKGYYHRGWFDIDEATGKPEMKETEDCAFGNSCYYFNGNEYLALPDQAAWNLEDDFFIMDLWVNFESIERTAALLTHAESFFLEWKPENAASGSSTAEQNASMQNSSLNFSFMSEERRSDGSFINHSYKQKWLPEVGKWYHISVIRNQNNHLQIFVDDELLGTSTPIRGTLRDGGGMLEIGGYDGNKVFNGKMDNIRIARGRTKWDLDQAGKYFFNEPKGLVVVGDYLYVVDSGHGRIVRISKDFKEWSHFGDIGSGQYQFYQPTDIFYYNGSFYITDTGNNRVIRTNLQTMADHLKGQYGGSWDVVYSSDSPGLTGVYVDDSEWVVTDAYNGTIIRNGNMTGSKNPRDNLFKFTSPIDVMKNKDGSYLILDGTSHYDQATQVFGRALEVFGTDQPDNINVKMNQGGLVSKTFVTDSLMSQQGGAGSGGWGAWSASGPGVSHCPDLRNEAVDFRNTECAGGGEWIGEGDYVDCNRASDPTVKGTSCKGQWDWTYHWPSCVQYVPAINYSENCSSGTCIYDCDTYCFPVTHECNVGTAIVAGDAGIQGPPSWAPEDVPGSKTGPDAKGGAPFNECLGIDLNNNTWCSWTSDENSLKSPSERALEKKITTLTSGLPTNSVGVEKLLQRLRENGHEEATRLASSTIRYHSDYTQAGLRFIDSCNSTYPVKDGFIMLRDGYMFKVFRVIATPSFERYTWRVNHVPIAWLDHDIWRGERLDCSFTLGGAQCPSDSICELENIIRESQNGLSPDLSSLDTLVARLDARGHDARRMTESDTPEYQPYRAGTEVLATQVFRDKCNSQAVVNNFFIEVDSTIYRVIKRSDTGGFQWMSEYTYLSDLMEDIRYKNQRFEAIDGTCQGPESLAQITQWRDSVNVSSWPIRKYLTVDYGENDVFFNDFYNENWQGDGENCASIIMVFKENGNWVAQNTEYLECGNAKKYWMEKIEQDPRFSSLGAGDCVGYILAPMKARSTSVDIPDPSERTNLYMTSWPVE